MTQHINLYNAAFEEKQQPFSARTMALALALIAVGLLCISFYSAVQAVSAERLAAQVREQVKRQREELTKLAAVSARPANKALEADVARLESEIKAHQASLQALASGELGSTTGFSQYFAAFGRQVVPGVWLTAITLGEAGNALRVQGRALRPELMTPFLRALGEESVMQGRKVTEMKLTARSSSPEEAERSREPLRFVEFSVSAPLEHGDAPASASGVQ